MLHLQSGRTDIRERENNRYVYTLSSTIANRQIFKSVHKISNVEIICSLSLFSLLL